MYDDEEIKMIQDLADCAAQDPEIGSGDIGEWCANLGLFEPAISEVWRQVCKIRSMEFGED